MTVSYSLQVSSVKFGQLLRLLFWWRGSIYKLLLPELLMFMIVYYLISLLYYFLTPDRQNTFENIAVYCDKVTSAFPVTFVLGFYVTLVVTRWWNIFDSIPWPDRAAFRINGFINGKNDQARIYRRTLVRYLNLMFVLCMRNVSQQVKKRFPTLESVKNSGLMTEKELALISKTDQTCGNYWIPGCWFQDLVKKAHAQGYLKEHGIEALFDEIVAFRDRCQSQLNYDWISIPIAYTQVITVAVYSYLFSRLLSDQYVPHQDNDTNTLILNLYARLFGDQNNSMAKNEPSPIFLVTKYFPVFTWFQFFFYLGWLKVAEELLNPLGNDDDDFELNSIIDRNLKISFGIVDDFCEISNFEIEKDFFWGKPAKFFDAEKNGFKASSGFLGSLADKFEAGWENFAHKFGENENENKIDENKIEKKLDEIKIEQKTEEKSNRNKKTNIFPSIR